MLSPVIPGFEGYRRYLDIIEIIASIPPYIYMVYNYENLIYKAISLLPTDLYMGWSETLLLMGVMPRHVGSGMSMIATTFLSL